MTKLFKILIFASLLLPSALLAETLAPPSVGQVERARAALEGNQELDPETRKQLVEIYDTTLSFLSDSETEVAKTKAFRAQTARAPQEIKRLQAELADPAKIAAKDFKAETNRGKLRQSLHSLTEEQSSVSEEYERMSRAEEKNAARRLSIFDELPRKKSRVRELSVEPSGSDLTGRSPLALEASRQRILAEKQLEQTRVESLQAEIEAITAREELIPLRVAVARRKLLRLEEEVLAARARLMEITQAEFKKQTQELEELRKTIAVFGPAARDLINQVSTLHNLKHQSGDNLNDKVAEITTLREDLHRQRLDLATDLSELRRRYRLVEGSSGIGRLLLSFQQSLPGESFLRKQSLQLRQELITTQLILFDLEEQRERLDSPAEETVRVIRRLEVGGAKLDWKQRSAVSEVVAQRDTLLNSLLRAFRLYVRTLSECIQISSQIAGLTVSAQEFLTPRVMWVRTEQSALVERGADGYVAWVTLTDGERWSRLARGTVSKVRDHWLLALLSLVLVTTLVVLRPRLDRIQAHYTSRVVKVSTDSFVYTLYCLLVILVRALPLPATVWIFGYFVQSSNSELGLALGRSLQLHGKPLFYLVFWYELLRPLSIGKRHFRWPEEVCTQLRRVIMLLIPPLFVVNVLLYFFLFDRTLSDLQAFVLVLGTLTLALVSLFVYLAMRSAGQLGSTIVASTSFRFLASSYWLWVNLLVGLPIIFAVLAVLGFQNAATGFTNAYRESLVFVGTLVFLSGLYFRFVSLAQRKHLLEQRLAERSRAKEEEQTEVQPVEDFTGIELDHFEDELTDMEEVDAQSVALFRSNISVIFVIGIFFIWSNVVPALQALSRVHIYPEVRIAAAYEEILQPDFSISAEATEQQPAAETSRAVATTPSLPGVPRPAPGTSSAAQLDTPVTVITLFDLLIALIVLYVAFVATTTLPAVIELAVLRRMNLSPGGQYAASSLTRYVVVIVGIIVASNVLGISWARVQWLAAALTFGLAFGLQEIFANFISGIIVLFEQPVRVGDIVTTSNVSGVVTRIRIRATTITDWDRKELIIPNKELVTGQIVNWTLSQRMIRACISVGVAYGTDTTKVIELLQEIASRDDRVAEDPPPFAHFLSFGSSSLDFELRAFIKDVSDNIPTQRDLRVAIAKEFQDAGIEIAFPQQDLHFRSSDAVLQIAEEPRRPAGNGGMALKRGA